MKIVFLDFDGVISTPIWDNEGKNFNFSSSSDGKLNDFQAICWLNELCKKTNAKIVLTTSWTIYKSLDFLKELLYNSGLSKEIEIIGKISHLQIENYHRERTEEIKAYLKENKNIEAFVILDDEEIFEPLDKYWVKCIVDYGFKWPEMKQALRILNNDYTKLILLDFDGVVNTRTWSERNKKICFLTDEDGKVGDFQAICWLNELCKKTNAKIVLTTIWRINNTLDSLREILYNSGLNKSIEIIGITPIHANRSRKEEIEEYLMEHKDLNVGNYVILDDEEIFGHEEHMVKCNIDYGFKLPEFQKALRILNG